MLTFDSEEVLVALEAVYRSGTPMFRFKHPLWLRRAATQVFGGWNLAIRALEARVGASIPCNARLSRDTPVLTRQARDPDNVFYKLRMAKRLSLRAASRLLETPIGKLYRWELRNEPVPPAVLVTLGALGRQDVERHKALEDDKAKGGKALAAALLTARTRSGILAAAIGVTRQRLHQLKKGCPEYRAAEIIAIWRKGKLIR